MIFKNGGRGANPRTPSGSATENGHGTAYFWLDTCFDFLSRPIVEEKKSFSSRAQCLDLISVHSFGKIKKNVFFLVLEFFVNL